MRILISGGSGFVGRELVPRLRSGGHDVAVLLRPQTRRADDVPTISWTPETGEIDRQALLGWGVPEAVVHLAGESVAGGRWTSERKRRIRESRGTATRLLSETLLRIGVPKVFVSASATGYYGDGGDEVLTEVSKSGEGFLAEVTIGWEKACEPMRLAGVRVVNLRFGVILSAGQGGALAKMLLPFKAGVGGKLGHGRQWMSWVAMNDAVEACLEAVANPRLQGPVNVVSPNPVRNKEFTKTLGKVLRRPTFMTVPGWLLRALFGQVADSLLASQRVLPKRLQEIGFVFKHPDLEGMLRSEI